MKTTSFNFKIQGKHESHSGSAVIVESHLDVQQAANSAFADNGDNRAVTVREIGTSVGPDQPGYIGTYEVYESYTDSGSDDYYYFAVMLSSREA